ncbi:MAG: hypothetical protein ABSH03_02950 [Candidatus Lustribacter sp.]
MPIAAVAVLVEATDDVVGHTSVERPIEAAQHVDVVNPHVRLLLPAGRMARSWWSLGFARDRVDLLESQRSWLSLDYARDDKLKNARDDKLQNARDDKLKNARDDKLKNARDDKLKNARDDKLNKTFIHQNKRSPEERIAVGRTRFTPPLPIP